ncbi:MAG: hypothetical protein IJ287_04420 [Methanobrevibacter sp.]|nr:hypothetical protein [Methanobrevibacter sp.]
MTNKKILLVFALFLCVLFSISGVAAGDLNESDVAFSDLQTDEIALNAPCEELETLNASAEDELISLESDDALNITYADEALSKENTNESALSANYADVYIDSITTKYNSGKSLYFGWYGEFDGYFKVYKSGSLVHDEYMYGYDEDYEWSLEGLSPGTYSAKLIAYNGITLGSGKIVIKKSSSKISVKSFSATAGSKFNCYAYVKDKYTGRYYDGGTVKFKINGKTYKAKLKDGVAVAKIKIPSKVKKFTCTATFGGGKNVYSSSTNFKITVKKKPVYKTVTIGTKMSSTKYVTKYYGKYKIQTFKFKHSFTTLCVFLYKNGKMLKKEQYLSKIQYKNGAKWAWTKWMHGTDAAVYHKYAAGNNIKIGNVKVKFKV